MTYASFINKFYKNRQINFIVEEWKNRLSAMDQLNWTQKLIDSSQHVINIVISER